MLLMKRSADFVVSLLAVLKAGCAYSVLPAELPEEALQHILQDAAPALVITHGGLHALLPKGANAPPVFNFNAALDAENLSRRSVLCWTMLAVNFACLTSAVICGLVCIAFQQDWPCIYA